VAPARCKASLALKAAMSFGRLGHAAARRPIPSTGTNQGGSLRSASSCIISRSCSSGFTLQQCVHQSVASDTKAYGPLYQARGSTALRVPRLALSPPCYSLAGVDISANCTRYNNDIIHNSRRSGQQVWLDGRPNYMADVNMWHSTISAAALSRRLTASDSESVRL
jgi:hypothetical protein